MPFLQEIEPLLSLQKLDQQLTRASQRKQSIPNDIQVCLTQIANHQKRIEAAKQLLREREVARKQLDTSIAQMEEKVIKLKTQQLTVKKNEEYQALTREIELAQEKIHQLEEEGIALLDQLDLQQKEVAQLQEQVAEEVKAQEGIIGQLKEQERQLVAEIHSLESQLKEQSGVVSEKLLANWQRLRKSSTKPPLVVPVKGKACDGCHMTISNDLESRLLASELLVFCDHCGRLLYRE
jgi:predicted  nucleic acid-binding Zn-ribbon protein